MIDVDRLTRVAQELSASIPADILEAQEILKQKESIITQTQLETRRIREMAENDSQQMKIAAQQEQRSKVDETEIVKGAETKAKEINQDALQEAQQILQDAQRRAYRIVDEADAIATTRREGADQYARETLFDLEERISALLGQVRRGIDALGIIEEVDAKVPS